MSRKLKRILIVCLYTIGFAGIMAGAVFAANNVAETRRNTDSIRANTDATQQLVQQLQVAVNDIKGSDQKQHDKQIAYLRCVIVLFTKNRPVGVTDIDHCTVTADHDTATTLAPTPVSTNSSGQPQHAQGNSKSGTSTPQPKPAPTPAPAGKICDINILFIHLNCKE